MRGKEDMDEMYDKKILREFQHPKNMGAIKNPDGIGRVGNPVCGDVMEIYLRVKDGRIADIKTKTFGCVAAIANASVLTQIAKGMKLEKAKKLTQKEIIARMGRMPPVKQHCSVLALDALRAAIEDYEKRGKKAIKNPKSGH